MRFDRREQLSRLRVPTLVSVAADDAVTPAYFAEALAKAIPDASLKLFPWGGHLLYHVVENEYNAAMLDFLRS